MTPQEILLTRYRDIRLRSLKLCAPLHPEDHVPQPVVDVSPPKWHLGHTSWFFESFVLESFQPDYQIFHPLYGYLFNSYYETAGERVARPQRGALSRPTVEEVVAYRAHVDIAMSQLLANPIEPALIELIELGLQHEQQHQELLLTDIKFILGHNLLHPLYDPMALGPLDLSAEHDGTCPPLDDWLHIDGHTARIGHEGRGFAFDNELPAHDVLIQNFEIRHALVTNAEYLAFILDGGYERHELWHSEGWDWVKTLEQRAPLYWIPDPDHANGWLNQTLSGPKPLFGQAPVTHISYYEAHAFCEWAGWRLPTEFEWEVAARQLAWGRRWEWTQSAYAPYPGFVRKSGAVGEYNGKFMVNQQVLRGSSFATSPGHSRLTYRNFFHAPLRWQYTGIRPARNKSTGSNA